MKPSWLPIRLQVNCNRDQLVCEWGKCSSLVYIIQHFPYQLCGLYFGMGAATLAIERSSMTKEQSVCRTQVHL